MAFNPTDVGGTVDQSIPQWKRELILRRRAIGRTLQVGNSSVKLTCPAVVALVRQPDNLLASDCNVIQLKSPPTSEEATAASSSLNQNRVDFHPSASSSAVSIGNMRLLDTCSDVNNLINGIDMKNKQSEVISSDVCVDYNLIMGEDKSIKKKSPSSRSKFDKKVTNSPQNLIIKKVTIEERNGGTPKKDDENLSDSSEELQYGPGIVNKLKSKYLSMTLREQKRISRPSIINLRRATSLENMLEDGDVKRQNNSNISVDSINKTENKTNNCRTTNIGKPVRLNSHQVTRPLSNRSLETMKRARSMDTLLKSESKNSLDKINSDGNYNICTKSLYSNNHKQIASTVNENIIIVENKQHCSTEDSLKQGCSSNGSPKHAKKLVTVTGELPPHDVVKQTLKIFETSPKKTVNTQNHSSLSKNVVGVTKRNVQQTNSSFKPSLSPKPIISPERLKQNKSRLSSPKKQNNESANTVLNKLQSKTLDPNFQLEHSDVICNNALRSDNNSVSVTLPKTISPRSISPIVSVLPNSEQVSSTPESTIELNSKSAVQSAQLIIDRTGSPITRKECEETDGRDYSKPVLESALENIRRGGVTVQFSFTSEKTQNPTLYKSYLPRSKSPTQALNTSLVKENLDQSAPNPNTAPLRQQIPPHTKQVGIIRPLMTRPHSSPALTEQEIEKNLINRVKSIEQPISKVVVAIKALPENVVLGSVSSDIVANKNLSLPRACTNSKVKSQRLWDDKLWHQNQNTIVFNFSDRKEVPDYIENDGLILRGKRDRPRPGEGGIILLDAGAEESSTDVEDPPSPCDVTFEGDNILINGKSNLKKSPKQVKLRIKFNDEATTMFEYPSEASLIEEEPSAAEASADVGASSSEETDSQATAAAPSSPRPLALGGNLGAYTPRQMGAGSWQLGVTPVQAPLTPTPAGPSHLPPEEDHFKPAPPESTVAWSEDTVSDLLF